MNFTGTKLSADTAKVRYQVSIVNEGGSDVTREVNEREVELTQSKGTWLISSIRLVGTDKVAFTRGMIF